MKKEGLNKVEYILIALRTLWALLFRRPKKRKDMKIKKGKRPGLPKRNNVDVVQVSSHDRDNNRPLRRDLDCLNQVFGKKGCLEGKNKKKVAEVESRMKRLVSVYKLYPGFNQFNVLRQKKATQKVNLVDGQVAASVEIGGSGGDKPGVCVAECRRRGVKGKKKKKKKGSTGGCMCNTPIFIVF